MNSEAIFFPATPKRVIARLDIKNSHVVKGIMMEGVQVVGTPVEMSIRYYEQGADEIILLDTVASLYQRLELPDIISEIVKNIFIPVCAGGGINSCKDAEKLFYSGADKVCINTSAIKRPELLKELSREFGAQSIVLQIDARFIKNKCQIFYNSGRDLSSIDIIDWLKLSQEYVGEILLTSIEKDGTGKGPDEKLISLLENYISVPLIYGGGISSGKHASDVFAHDKISGVALASYLHIDHKNIVEIKEELQLKNVLIREQFIL